MSLLSSIFFHLASSVSHFGEFTHSGDIGSTCVCLFLYSLFFKFGKAATYGELLIHSVKSRKLEKEVSASLISAVN
uniref:Putative ovule protein n=1 Tax=Solanum chacoense TaxID=4108 RepID=A0A0V0HA50_SOLCH